MIKMMIKVRFLCFLVGVFSLTGVQADELPNVTILATGGTIAGAGVSSTQYEGYQAAVTPVGQLLQNVPELAKVANVSGEQISQVASENVDSAILLKLAKRINQLLNTEDVDGVVITHGTNTMEETAYFLNLVVKSKKPVVLVGSMRPATSMSADGPMNLFRAVIVAGSKKAHDRGVMVVMNDQIIGARDLQKTDTITVDTFKAPNFGYLGYVIDDQPHFYRGGLRKHTHQTIFDVSELDSLPEVSIVYGHQNDSRVALDALVKVGFQGIVHAGSGTAAISSRMLPAIKDAIKEGVVVVRAPRTSLGIVTRNMEVNDDALSTVACDTLNPPKARILLMLALTQTSDPLEIQKLFETY